MEFIEGLVETYPGLQYLDGFPQVIFFFATGNNFELFRQALSDRNPLKSVQIKVVLRADVERGSYDKVAVISGAVLCSALAASNYAFVLNFV